MNITVEEMRDSSLIEVWKPVVGYEDRYEVSNMGRVRNSRGKVLSSYTNRTEYISVVLCRNYTSKGRMIHRLVAIAFLPNPENKKEVNHINGIRGDNRLENLEWVTREENQIHSWKHLNRRAANEGKTGAAHSFSKPINQLNLDGSFVKRWDCMMDVQRELGFHTANLSSACLGKYKQARGFKWEYADDKNPKSFNLNQ